MSPERRARICFARADDAEDIRVEKRLRLLDGGLLESAEYTQAGVVDEHVDPSCRIEHRLHGMSAPRFGLSASR
jgi:hypothetical protein